MERLSTPVRSLRLHLRLLSPRHQHVQVAVRYHSLTEGLAMSALRPILGMSVNIHAMRGILLLDDMFVRQFSSKTRPDFPARYAKVCRV